MRTVNVRFVGGILDGTRRAEHFPDHWQFLRLEKAVDNSRHVYSGEVNKDWHADTVVQFVGTELLDDLHSDFD